MFLALLLTACGGTSTTTLGVDAVAEVDTLRSLVDAHVEAVSAAESMDEVDTLEADHTSDMADAMDQMDGMMSEMMGCSMGDMMSGSMSDADGHMQEMMDAVSAHTTDHAGHADMTACWDEEDTYSGMMGDHLDAMADDMAGFDDDATCSGGGGMM